MNNIIIFPPIKKEEIIYSQKLNNFFYKNNINPLIDDFFEIQKLINLYDANLNEYYRIKIELELKGFNFCGDEKFQFIQKIEWEKPNIFLILKIKHFQKNN